MEWKWTFVFKNKISTKRIKNKKAFNIKYIPFIPANLAEIFEDIAGKPAMNTRRNVHNPALNPCHFRRLHHLIHQQFRQQKMPWNYFITLINISPFSPYKNLINKLSSFKQKKKVTQIISSECHLYPILRYCMLVREFPRIVTKTQTKKEKRVQYHRDRPN